MATPTGVDVHAHFFPEAFIAEMERAGGAFGAGVDRSDARGPALYVGASRTPPLEARYWDLDLRLKAMNRSGVAVQALSLTAPMVYWADGDAGARLCAAWNDAASAAHRAHPDRFVACATLPFQDPPRAREELERAARLPGVRGVYMGTNVRGRELSDPDFFPIFARMAALGLPLLLHPIDVIGAQRLKPFYLSNLLGNPFDSAIAASHLVFGGVLDRLPKLEVCLPHAGGALPYLHGRLRHGQAVRPECEGVARKPLSAYLRRFTYDIISHDPGALRYLIQTVGADRVALGTDFCFDMGYDRPLAAIQAKAVGLGTKDQDRVIRGTGARLLRLG
ncbi:MAG TPA: amidohydrolase family protein [Methylomirabilota bacterium]|nr:amidohydrolase family protein [Methylomirabilota bacterium]